MMTSKPALRKATADCNHDSYFFHSRLLRSILPERRGYDQYLFAFSFEMRQWSAVICCSDRRKFS